MVKVVNVMDVEEVRVDVGFVLFENLLLEFFDFFG